MATTEEVEYVEYCIDQLINNYPDVKICILLRNGKKATLRLDDCMCYSNDNGTIFIDAV